MTAIYPLWLGIFILSFFQIELSCIVAFLMTCLIVYYAYFREAYLLCLLNKPSKINTRNRSLYSK